MSPIIQEREETDIGSVVSRSADKKNDCVNVGEIPSGKEEMEMSPEEKSEPVSFQISERLSILSSSSQPVMKWNYSLPPLSKEEVQQSLSKCSSFLFIPSPQIPEQKSERSSSSKPSLARKASKNITKKIKKIMQYDSK